MLTQSLHSPRLPALTTATLDDCLRNSGAPVLTTTSDCRIFEYSEPHNDADIAAWDVVLSGIHREIDPIPTNTLGPGPRLSAPAGEPTDAMITTLGKRLLAPKAAGQEIKQKQQELSKQPAPERRQDLPRKGRSGRIIREKVDQACARCR